MLKYIRNKSGNVEAVLILTMMIVLAIGIVPFAKSFGKARTQVNNIAIEQTKDSNVSAVPEKEAPKAEPPQVIIKEVIKEVPVEKEVKPTEPVYEKIGVSIISDIIAGILIALASWKVKDIIQSKRKKRDNSLNMKKD